MKNSSLHKGFSLIELMVVIAIVAILAAVAAPAYKDYIQKVKFSKLVTLGQHLIDQSVAFRNVHGYYPLANELGYPDGTSSATGEGCTGVTYVENPKDVFKINEVATGGGLFTSGVAIGCGSAPPETSTCHHRAFVVVLPDPDEFPEFQNQTSYIMFTAGEELNSSAIARGCEFFTYLDGALGADGAYANYVNCPQGVSRNTQTPGGGLYLPTVCENQTSP